MPVPQPRVGRGDMRQREAALGVRMGASRKTGYDAQQHVKPEGYSESSPYQTLLGTLGYQRGIPLPEIEEGRAVRRVP